MKKWLTIITTIIIVLVVDLTTKHFLFDVEYFNLIPHVISIATNGGNAGAAFGAFSGKTATLIIVSVLLIVALFIFNHYVKNKNVFYCIAFGLIVGGALGNMWDRLFYTDHLVRDFIFLDFWPTFPTFNIADSCLCVGVVMLAIFLLFMMEKKHDNKV